MFLPALHGAQRTLLDSSNWKARAWGWNASDIKLFTIISNEEFFDAGEEAKLMKSVHKTPWNERAESFSKRIKKVKRAARRRNPKRKPFLMKREIFIKSRFFFILEMIFYAFAACFMVFNLIFRQPQTENSINYSRVISVTSCDAVRQQLPNYNDRCDARWFFPGEQLRTWNERARDIVNASTGFNFYESKPSIPTAKKIIFEFNNLRLKTKLWRFSPGFEWHYSFVH